MIGSCLALALLAAAPPPAPEKLYEGQPLAVWQARIKTLHPRSAEAQAAIPGLAAIALDAEAPWFTRKQAALTLGRIGNGPQSSAECLKPLVQLLAQAEGGAEAPRCWAAKGIALMGPRAAPAGAVLVKIVRDEKQPLLHREAMLEPLALIGPDHPDVLPAFVEILQAPPTPGDAAELRETALLAILLLGPRGDVAVPFLTRIIRNPRENEATRRSAAQALGAIGPRAEPAAVALGETIFSDPSPAVRDVAAEALGQIGPRAMPLITPMVTHRDPAARIRGALAAAQLATGGKPLLPALLANLSDADVRVRLASVEAVAAIEPDHARIIPVAIALLADSDRDVRARATKLLDRLGPRLAGSRDQIVRLLDDPREPVRRSAQRLLDRLDMAP
jgi:HEAT repeat protein